MVVHVCGFVQETAVPARTEVSALWTWTWAVVSLLKRLLVSIERRSRDLRSSPALPDFPPPSFSPFLPLAHMSTCPALCCMLRKTRKQIPFPPVAIPLNLVLSGATLFCGRNPYLFYWLSSELEMLSLFQNRGTCVPLGPFQFCKCAEFSRRPQLSSTENCTCVLA